MPEETMCIAVWKLFLMYREWQFKICYIQSTCTLCCLGDLDIFVAEMVDTKQMQCWAIKMITCCWIWYYSWIWKITRRALYILLFHIMLYSVTDAAFLSKCWCIIVVLQTGIWWNLPHIRQCSQRDATSFLWFMLNRYPIRSCDVRTDFLFPKSQSCSTVCRRQLHLWCFDITTIIIIIVIIVRFTHTVAVTSFYLQGGRKSKPVSNYPKNHIK